MPNGTYGGVRGRKTKVGGKLLLRFPPTRFYTSFSFLKPEISDECAIFKITLKNGHSKNNELEKNLHK